MLHRYARILYRFNVNIAVHEALILSNSSNNKYGNKKDHGNKKMTSKNKQFKVDIRGKEFICFNSIIRTAHSD